MSGWSCASQRMPYDTVRLRVGCHLSWMKSAGSVCGMSCVPASSTDEAADAGLLQEQEQRAGDVGAGRASAGQLVEPLEHSTYFGPNCA